MKNFTLFLTLFIFSINAASQQRILVTPTNDVIPLAPRQSAREVINAMIADRSKQGYKNESPSEVGYPPPIFPRTDSVVAYHEDVLAMWFTAPATGTIDTIFWQAGNAVGAQDSVVYIRVDSSHIGPNSGPGFGYPASCHGWGYYSDFNDPASGITGFLDFATNPVWQVHPSSGVGPPSFPPAGGSFLLPGLYGLPVLDHAGKTNALSIYNEIAMVPSVRACDTILISIRIGGFGYAGNAGTSFSASRTNAPYPSRIWKFYEYGDTSLFGPPGSTAICGNSPIGGWYLYGGPNHDSTDGLVLNWWFSMTVDTTLPRCNLSSYDVLLHTPWSLVSLPLRTAEHHTSALFPGAISKSYAYNGSTYVATDTMANRYGYWIKMSPPQSLHFNGDAADRDTFSLSAGWNLIGSTGVTAPTANIVSIPPGIMTSQFFAYEGSYSPSAAIEPGRGYWVKTDQPGKIVLSNSTILDPAARINIVQSDERPPSPPSADGRENAPVYLPERFELSQNYPNPFNPSTTIHYAIPKSAHVKLSVFNVLGEEVAVLVDDSEGAGFKSVSFDASGLPSGLYAYALTAGEFRGFRKMMVVR